MGIRFATDKLAIHAYAGDSGISEYPPELVQPSRDRGSLEQAGGTTGSARGCEASLDVCGGGPAASSYELNKLLVPSILQWASCFYRR